MEKMKPTSNTTCIPRKRKDKSGSISNSSTEQLVHEPVRQQSTPPPPAPTTTPRKGDLVITNRNSFISDASDAYSNKTDCYVGFDSLPKQVFRKCVEKGFQFTLMVAGEGGLGKSTLINSLFLTDIYVDKPYENAASRYVGKTESINCSTFELKEGNVKLQLTIVDTPGFGDEIDNTDCCNSVLHYVENQFESYLNTESRVCREVVPDTRVHCCLYFIPPTGHGLRPADIAFMKKLDNMVNIVPVIAKADSLTAEECAKFKLQIMKEIEANEIRIYTFPPSRNGEAEIELASLRRVPFAVIGSNTIVEINGKLTRGRKYPWGTVLVENTEHCDFIALRNMLIRTHMHDLVDVTDDVHYEHFRSERLSTFSSTGGLGSITCGSLNINPMEQIEREREAQENKLRKMEKEMELVFEMKVKEKQKKLKNTEEEFMKKFELTMRTLGQSKTEIEQRQKRMETEREQFYRTYGPEGLHEKEVSEKERKEKKKMRLFNN